MITCTKRLEFDAAHRVLGHTGKCRHIHGHRYAVEITVKLRDGILDGLGMVVDFGVIKERVGKWIDDNLDHNIILHKDDPLLVSDVEDRGVSNIFGGRRPHVLTCNPTAENLAALIHAKAIELLSGERGVEVVKVRVYETPTAWADSIIG